MRPPPTPAAIDPALEHCSATPSSNTELDQLLLPSPGVDTAELGGRHRPAYPPVLNDLDSFSQDSQLAASFRHHEPEANPLLNSYPEPWTAQSVNGGSAYPSMNQINAAIQRRMSQTGPLPQYWHPHSISENDCSVTGRYPPDSAYWTKSPATMSIFSGEPLASNQECPSLTGAMNEMEIPREQNPFDVHPHLSQDHPCSGFATRQADHQLDLKCLECNRQSFKNKSELKYVSLVLLSRLSLCWADSPK